ncbi:MAG: sortase [Acidimicrobiia bacterium]
MNPTVTHVDDGEIGTSPDAGATDPGHGETGGADTSSTPPDAIGSRPLADVPDGDRRSARWGWPTSLNWVAVLRRGLLVLACTVLAFVVWLVVIAGLSYDRAQQGLERELSAALVDAVAPVNQPFTQGEPLALIEIPALDLRQIVVSGSGARQTVTGLGHLRTSALPGQPGVSVILGRRASFGGPFGSIGTLEAGDIISTTTGQGVAEYEVVSNGVFDDDDAAAFIADGDALLLVTSDPTLIASQRLVVVAEPTGELFVPGTRVPQTPITPAELGLGGDAGAAVGLLIWLEIAALAMVAAVVMMRRWLRWPAWVIVTPVLAAVGWMVFEQVALLLPATI